MCRIPMLTEVRLFCAAGLLALAASPVLAQAAPQRILYYSFVPGFGYVPVYAPSAVPSTRTVTLASMSSPTYGAPRQSSGEPGYYTEDYPGPTSTVTPQKRPARIRVRLPADAELFINDKPTTSTGPVREFETPELDPDQIYNYLLRARWTEGGISVEKRFRVRALSGNRVTVNFVPIAQERPRRIVAAAAPVLEATASLPPLSPPPSRWTAPYP
jgi:uncharacterized protein (TIGR03000 family)